MYKKVAKGEWALKVRGGGDDRAFDFGVAALMGLLYDLLESLADLNSKR